MSIRITETKIFDPQRTNSQTVIIRADCNIPFQEGKVLDSFKLETLLPLLEQVKSTGQKCVLLTHLGQPKDKEPELSTENLLSWFQTKGFEVGFARTVEGAKSVKEQFVLLENLRFFPGEESCHREFAQTLSELGQVLVFEAFGSAHRKTASTWLLPDFFDQKHKFFGPLAAQEIKKLSEFASCHSRPYALVMGGAKPEKLEWVEKVTCLPQDRNPDEILIGGLLGYKLEHDPEGAKTKQKLLGICQTRGINLHLPEDFVFSEQGAKRLAIDIGPKSIDRFCQVLSRSEKIFCNGVMGMAEHEDAQAGTFAVLGQISQLGGQESLAVAGGGDCVRFIKKLGLEDGFWHLSTGGGSALSFLASGKPLEQLPGLAKFLNP